MAGTALERVGIVVCDDEEVDKACERRGYAQAMYGDGDKRGAARADGVRAAGTCVQRRSRQDARNESTRCVEGMWHVRTIHVCELIFGDMWQGVDGFQI